MVKKTGRPAPVEQEGEIELERGGERYVGRYQTRNGMITVSYGDRQKTTQIGNSPLQAIARMLLSEIAGPPRP